MALAENKPYTLDDLAIAVSSYKEVLSRQQEWLNKAKSAREAMESHQREADKIEEETQRRRGEVRKILSNLEKV